jgi:hypothetical protein
MKTLHLLRSEPDEWGRRLMRKLSPNEEIREFPLHRGRVDYDQLIAEIFKSDRVIAWW